jgi:hypothetical protein
VRSRADRLVPLALVAEAAVLLALVARMIARPFWYNEQWRAWHLALGLAPRADTNSPIALGFAALTRLSTAVLGNGEVATRLPEVVSLPVLAYLAYLLARRFLGPLGSGLTVALLLVNRMVLTFAAELAPYTVEAACTVGVLLCWLAARDATPRGRTWRYAVMAALALVATPVVFVLAPLLAFDVVAAARGRQWSRLAAPVATGVVALAHLAFYVGRQTNQAHAPYWRDFFVPHSPGGAVAFTVRRLAGWVPRALTGGTAHFPVVPDGEIALASPARVALTVVVAAALAAGLVTALRERRLRPLALALLGALAGQWVASYGSYWPFGFTRVNTFLLPLLYLLAAVGAARLGALVPRAAAVVAGAVAFALVAFVGARQVATVRAEAGRPAFASTLPDLVAIARERAAPGDEAVLVHPMAEKGWAYYTRFRGGGIPAARTLVLQPSGADVAGLGPFLAAHPAHVYVMVLQGVGAATVRGVEEALVAGGYARTGLWRAASTGGLLEYTAGTTGGG